VVISLVVGEVVGVTDEIIVEWVRKGGVLKSLWSLLLKDELSSLIHSKKFQKFSEIQKQRKLK
jgi:hypothetical protein